MPAFSYAGIVLSFAAFKTSAATIQLPHDQPLPKALITRITRSRVKELEARDAKWMSR